MTDLDEDEKLLLAARIAWLDAADPDDWHRVMIDFNWGEPLYLLDWIVRQDRCDVATALDIFWKGQPGYWIEEERESDEKPDGFSYLNKRICEYVADRVVRGGYRRSEIAFKPDVGFKKDYVDLAALEKRLNRPNIRTHPDLIRDRPGREADIDTQFYQRYPQEFHLSYFDEELSDALEANEYFTPETRASWEKVEEINDRTLRSLPVWLQGGTEADQIGGTAAATEAADKLSAVTPSRAPSHEADGTDEEASARVRSFRAQAARPHDSVADGVNAVGVLAWMKRLLGR